MAQLAAHTINTQVPTAVRAANGFNLPAQQGLSLAEMISSGAYRMIVGIERLVTRH